MGCMFSKESDDRNIYDMSPIREHPVIFVNGVPGAGSQTVAQTLADMTGYCTIRPGDLLREEGAKDTPRGHAIRDRMMNGEEISEQVTLDLIKEAMLSRRAARGFILVGFPRSPRMSAMFSRQVKWPEKVVALQVDDEVATHRLQSKLSELGRPECEISAARHIVRQAAQKVKYVHKRFAGHIVTVDSSGNPNALANHLKELLADTIEAAQRRDAAPAPPETTETAETVPDDLAETGATVVEVEA